MSDLPVRPSLSSLRKQAKSLLSSYRDGVDDAKAAVQEHHPKPDGFSSLRDAQLVVARQYGYPSWAELCDAAEAALDAARSIDERADLFADLACLCYSPNDNISRRERAARLVEETPDLTQHHVYAAAAAADLPALTSHIESDPECVNRVGGIRSWPPLMYLAYSRVSVNGSDPLTAMQALIDAGADPTFHIDGTKPAEQSTLGGWYWTALTGVIGEGENGTVQQSPHPQAKELATMLLDAGASPNDGQGLYNSIFTPGNEWLELLISRGLSADDRVIPEDPEAEKTLDYQLARAAKVGLVDRAKFLLENGADPRGADRTYTGKSYVEIAVDNGFGEILDLLVDHGAERPELSDADRYRIAVVGGDEVEARRLLEGDPSLSDQPGMLIQSAHQGEIDRVRLILDLGCDVNARNPNGRAALHEAAWKGDLEMMQLLLDRGAECEIRSNDHDATPIGFANHAGRLEARDYLIERTRDAYDLARFGNTSRLLEILEEDGSRAKVALSNGMTALHVVPETEDAEAVIDKLIASGADIDKKNDDGKTPLASAEASDRSRVAELLRARGATV